VSKNGYMFKKKKEESYHSEERKPIRVTSQPRHFCRYKYF